MDSDSIEKDNSILKYCVTSIKIVVITEVFMMKAVFLDRDGTIGGTGGGVHPFDFQCMIFLQKL